MSVSGGRRSGRLPVGERTAGMNAEGWLRCVECGVSTGGPFYPMWYGRADDNDVLLGYDCSDCSRRVSPDGVPSPRRCGR